MGNVTVLKSVWVVKLQESVANSLLILHARPTYLIVYGGAQSHEAFNHYLYSMFIVNMFYSFLDLLFFLMPLFGITISSAVFPLVWHIVSTEHCSLLVRV
jgi:hypothetical protein